VGGSRFQAGRFGPLYALPKKPLDPNEGLGDMTKLYAPSQFFSFHEYAHGDIDNYFDENGERLSEK
jgi:hypothetical protein